MARGRKPRVANLDIAPSSATLAPMSAANVELARRGYEAVARGDLGPVSRLLADDVKWHGGDADATGSCRSRDEALTFLRVALKRRRVGRLVDLIDAGDDVVIIMQPPTVDGVTPPRRANVTTFRDGKVVEMVAFENPEAALTAAGISVH
jgi:ketosteroid isomerase-like protein